MAVIFLSLLAFFVALAPIRTWGQTSPRWILRTMAWIASAMLTLRGVAGLVVDGTRDPVWWPTFLVGGILFGSVAWATHGRLAKASTMTWRALNYGTAENDAGTRVSRVGYKLLAYERGGRRIEIDVEEGADDLGIYANSIHRWEPDDVAVSDSERAAILQDIEAALRVLKVPFAVLWN